MSTSHVITRSVRDSAAVLDAVSGPEPGAPYGISARERPFLEEIHLEPGHLRIGYHTRPAYGRQVHPECVRAVEQACRLLEDMGHAVEEVVPDYREEDAALNWCIVMIGNAAAHVDKLVQTYGHAKVRQNLEPSNYAFYSIGRKLKAPDFVKAKRSWRQFGILMDQMLDRYDMLLTPTLGEPPVPVGSQQLGKSDQRSVKRINSWAGRILLGNRKLTDSILEEMIRNTMKGQMPFTLIANMTGQPAMSVPLHWTEDGLPCGVQLMSRLGEEAGLLRLAARLEKAQPWFDRKPPILQ